jgi:ABC-type hemin transport system substrate-binding protein
MPTTPGHRFLRVFVAVVCLAITVVAVGCTSGSAPSEARATKPRLVSLSPGVTATVVALGGASSLVAVSDYCELPTGMNELPRVGSALTLNLEKLAALRHAGSLTVVGPKMQLQWSDVLHKLATVQVLPWSTPSELVESTIVLGSLLGEEAAATELAGELEAALPKAAPASAARVALLERRLMGPSGS